MLNNTIISTPKRFTSKDFGSFLYAIREMPFWNNAKIPNVFLDTHQTADVDLLGLLILCNFLDYTSSNHCFLRPSTDLLYQYYLKTELKNNGFEEYVSASFGEESVLGNVKFVNNNKWFIAPIKLIEETDADTKKRNQDSMKSISRYYQYNDDVAFVVLQSIGELFNNFKSHANASSFSYLVAKGDRCHCEIACIDNGKGIVNSLKPILNSNSLSTEEILELSVKKGVSSKKNEGHMGCGLWLINEFVSECNGYFCICSNSAIYINNKGLCEKKSFAPWKGTILYLDLPLDNVNAINRVFNKIEV